MITKARKNISSAKASSGPIDGQSTEPLAQNQNKKGVRPWTFLFLLGLVLIVFALIYVWTQRYNLIEAHIEKLATKMGFEISLDIQSIELGQARIADINLQQEGREVFKAGEIILDYNWRELKDKNQLQKVVLTTPHIWAELDKSGKLVFPVMQEGEGASVPLPRDGIAFQGGRLNLASPYLSLETGFDGYYKSLSDTQIILDVEHSDLNYDSSQAQALFGQGSGDVKLVLMEEASEFDVDIHFPKLAWGDNQLEGLSLQSRFRPEISEDSFEFNGPFQARIVKVNTPDFTLQNMDLKWDGRIFTPLNPTSQTSTSQTSTATGSQQSDIEGVWTIEIEKGLAKSPSKREKLARTLSLNKALIDLPMVGNFANLPKDAFKRIFAATSVKGGGEFKLGSAGYHLSLSQPLTFSNTDFQSQKGDVLTLSPRLDRPVIEYRSNQDGEGEILLNMDIELDGPWPLELQDINLVAGSPNGQSFEAVETVTANLIFPKTWQGVTEDGRPARLAPLKGALTYQLDGQNRQAFTFEGPVNYDGDVPGGYVENLSINGLTDILRSPTRLNAKFQHNTENNITISRFETTTGWRGEDLDFTFVGEAPELRRRGRVEDGTVGKIAGRIGEFTGQIIDAENARHLDLKVDAIDLNGTIAGEDQNWRLSVKNADITSPDLPDGGSKAFAPSADMTFKRRGDMPVQFVIHAPHTDVETRSVNTDGMDLKVTGQSDDFTVDYTQGLAKFVAEEIPVLPLHGQVHFNGTLWDGKAQTYLPDTPDTPIFVDYTFEDGRGTANVDIPEFIFTPGGFQPQSLSKAFQGKIADVDGFASAKIQLAFGPDMPLLSSGTASLRDISLGTLPGPFSGINTDLSFSSIFPLKTTGRQKLTMKSFDPGFPLKDGEIEFELREGGVILHEAQWPLGAGFVSLDPTDWSFDAKENRVTLRLTNLSVGDVVNNLGNGEMQMTGKLEGMLPVVVEGVRTRVDDGHLSVKDGGTIKFQSKSLSAATDTLAPPSRNLSAQFGSLDGLARLNPLYRENQVSGASEGFAALKNFDYKKLELELDGPLDGNIKVRIVFDGSNEQVLDGAVFAWDVSVEGELLNIARSLGDVSSSELIKRSLDQRLSVN